MWIKTHHNHPACTDRLARSRNFLKWSEQQLITQAHENDPIPKKERNKTVVQLLRNLQKSEEVIIATDKPNSFQVISIKRYIKWVKDHLRESAKEIERERLVEIFNLAQETKLELEGTLSEKELTFLSKTLEFRSIPTPPSCNISHRSRIGRCILQRKKGKNISVDPRRNELQARTNNSICG